MKTITVLLITGFFHTISQAETISILELVPVEYKVGFADLWIGKNIDNKKVLLEGEEIQHYLFAHAPSSIMYKIPEGVTSFNAWGIKTEGDGNVVGSWIYSVVIDGNEVFRSKPLVTYENCVVPINVEIPFGAKIIQLKIDDMSNAFADHSIWAFPTFNR